MPVPQIQPLTNALHPVTCRFFGLTALVKKRGTGNGGHPRYRCQVCCRSFQLDYTYKVCQSGIKEQVVDLAMNNAGIRDTARALHINLF